MGILSSFASAVKSAASKSNSSSNSSSNKSSSNSSSGSGYGSGNGYGNRETAYTWKDGSTTYSNATNYMDAAKEAGKENVGLASASTYYSSGTQKTMAVIQVVVVVTEMVAQMVKTALQTKYTVKTVRRGKPMIML